MITTRTHGAWSSFVTSCILFTTIFIGVSNPLAYSQSCDIHVAPEPNLETKERSHRAVAQSNIPNSVLWEDLSAGVVSDDQYINIDLEPGAFSQTLTFDQFNLNIPANSIVEGVKVLVEGNHDGTIPTTIDLSLTAANVNVAAMVFSGTAWPATDGTWGYGANWYNWSTHFTAAQVNDNSFGVNLRIHNNNTEALTANLDRVSIQIYYKAPYSVCLDHACIPFFTTEIPGALEYDWTIPSGFEVISAAANESTVLIAATTAGAGEYQVCLRPVMATGNASSCCRYFNVADCTSSSIGDFVWNDINGNGLQDIGELGVPDIDVQLYDTYGMLVGTSTSDANGAYQFPDVKSGDYYIKVILNDDEELSPAGAGSSIKDSDITGVLGFGTSDYFFVPAGVDYNQIDIGLIISSKIEGLIWLDNNGDGVRQDSEALLSDVTVQLLDVSNTVLLTEVTGNDGSYIFMDLQEQVYQVKITLTDGYVITLRDVGTDDRDSDFYPQGIFLTNILMDDLVLDGGMYKKASFGDYLWVDLNRDGLQDVDDEGLSGITLTLTDSNNQEIQTITDSNGAYAFNDLTPGAYTLSWSIDDDFILTGSNLGTGDNDSREATLLGLDASYSFDLDSDANLENLDFGFQYKPSTVSGQAWNDLNNDGSIDTGENGMAGIAVGLYAEGGVLLDTKMTDASGAYDFQNLNPGSYFVIFSKPQDFEFSNGPSEHVTGSVSAGSTDIFSLDANQNVENNAGYFSAITLGDYIWLDLNRDGIQDSNESGIAGVLVVLRDASGALVSMKATDSSGAYLFENVISGSYTLGFVAPSDLMPTAFDQGTGSNDSRAFTFGNGAYLSQSFTYTQGTTDLNLDFGFQYRPSSLTGLAWNDLDNDGLLESGENGMPNINVELYSSAGLLIETKVTDASGAYDFQNVNPGTYYITFSKPNNFEFTDGPSEAVTGAISIGSTDIFNLDPNQSLDHNAGYFSAITLGDYIWFDINRNGIQDTDEPGIPDVMVVLRDPSGSPVAMTMTDGNGMYRFDNVTTGSYTIGFMVTADLIPTAFNQGTGSNDSRIFNLNGGAYLSQTLVFGQGDTNLDLDFGFIAKPSSISGFTFNDMDADGTIDTEDTAKPNVVVTLFNDSNVAVANTTTDAAGLYEFSNLNPGTYYVVFENITSESYSMGVDSDVTNTISIGATDMVTIAVDQNLNLDAGYYSGITIGNYVWIDQNRDGIQDASEMGAPGVVMLLKDASGTTVDMQTTDANGAYVFDIVTPGAYTVVFDLAAELTSTLADQGNGSNDSRMVTLAGTTFTSEVFNLSSGDSNLDIDFGIVSQPASISGYTFHDRDADGTNDIEDEAKANVKVELYTSTGVLVAMTLTDVNGTYTFDNLNPGDYYVLFENILNEMFSMGIDSDVTNANSTGSTDVVSLAVNQNLDLDAGYFCFGSVGDMVWIDDNMDGLYQTSEMPFAGVEVLITNDNGVVLGTQTTGADGKYLFTNLLPDYYFVSFNIPSNYIPTEANVGTDITIDSDVTEFVATNTTSFFQLWSKEDNLDIDGGFSEVTALIAGLTWLDVDKSGTRTSDDILLPGILVELYSQAGVLVDNTTSSASGAYSFTNLTAGDYYVKFNFPTQYIITDANMGSNENRDSDVTEANGALTTDLMTLTSVTQFDQVDAGVFEYSTLGDMVWLDEDENGNFESGEPGIADVTVDLLDNTGAIVMTTTTDVDGKYSFTNVIPGTYRMQFDTIQNYNFTAPNIGTDNIDSDAIVDVTTGLGVTLPINVISGSSNNSVDAGYQFNSGASLQGVVWEDLNADGIRTTNEPLIQDAIVNVVSSAGVLLATTTTDVNGNYEVNNISLEDFHVEFIPASFDKITLPNVGADDSIDSDITEANGAGTTDTFSPMILEMFTDVDGGFYKTSSIGDFVWDDLNMNGIQDLNEPGRADVAIELRTAGGTLVESTVSAVDGSYIFNDVDPGSYTVSFNSAYPYVFTMENAGTDDTKDSDAIVNGTSLASTAVFDIVSGMDNLDIDAGVFEQPLVTIVGGVFEDMNGDGMKDGSDMFLNGINVTLVSAAGVPLQETTTIDGPNGVAGYYTFTDLPPEMYYLSFGFPNGTVSTFPNIGPEALDSDVTDMFGFGTTDILDYTQAGTPTFVCGGFYNTVSIGNYVWGDFLTNGIQDPSEDGINSVPVRLYNAAGVQQEMVFTTNDANGDAGYYLFDDLAPGSYYIQIDNGLTMTFTNPFEGTDTDVDSDIDNSNGPSTSPTIVLQSGDSDLSIDAGLLMEPGSIGDFVWIDDNGNGCQDGNEMGLNGVVVELYTAAGMKVAETMTGSGPNGANGFYIFDNIQPGAYYVVFNLDVGFNATIPDMCGDDSLDSDVTDAIVPGSTNIFSLSAGENDMDLDLGVTQPSCLGDRVWNDTNQDGIQDSNELGLEDIGVELYYQNPMTGPTLVGIKKTDNNGNYEFCDLDAGLYFIEFSDIPFGWVFSPQDQGNDDTADSDVNSSGVSPFISLASGVDFEDLDAGIYDLNLTSEPYQISIWPNPSSGFTTHSIESTRESSVRWEIVKSTGEIAMSHLEEDITVGINKFHTDFSNLPAGMYQVRYFLRGKRIVKPLIIINR